MNNLRQKRILISEPNSLGEPRPFFPYMYAVLKSYWERNFNGGDLCSWLDPIYMNGDIPRLLEPYGDTTIDVLGLSCYTWNWEVQCGIAKAVKSRNPECLVIAGGPEPDYKDREFFRKYPYIDVIAVKDGEITLSKILLKLIEGNRDFRDIGGLYLPGENAHIWTGNAEVPTVFDHSPYIDQSSYYEKLLAQFGPGSFDATLETNRGCPYSCSFCDWGSSTMSKVRRFDAERVQAEVKWLGRMQVAFVMLADANFGILSRDVEIAEWINETKRQYDYPKYFYFSAAKNNPERVIEIARKFAETGISPTHTLAIQHTSDEVLAATDRANISAPKQVEVAKALMKSGIPINVQLILGIPGDNYKLWKTTFADLMERGLHEDYQVFYYNLLPNAPAAEKSFIEKWEVETINRFIPADGERPWKRDDTEYMRLPKSKLIVKSKTYTREDWVKMVAFKCFVRSFHCGSLTQLIAKYLRLTHGVPYLDFYEAVIDGFVAKTAPARDWYEAVEKHCVRFLECEDKLDRMEVEELPGYGYSLHPSHWISLQACFRHARFYAELKSYLVSRFPSVRNLGSAVDYQQAVVILPAYDRNVGKAFKTDFDWVQYFAKAKSCTGEERLGEPDPTPGAIVRASDRTCGEQSYMLSPLDWGSGTDEEKWVRWIQHTVLIRRSAAKNNLQSLQLQRRRSLLRSLMHVSS